MADSPEQEGIQWEEWELVILISMNCYHLVNMVLISEGPADRSEEGEGVAWEEEVDVVGAQVDLVDWEGQVDSVGEAALEVGVALAGVQEEVGCLCNSPVSRQRSSYCIHHVSPSEITKDVHSRDA